MLKKLNDLYNSLIYEQAEDIWLRKITSDNEFYAKYLLPLRNKYSVDIVKARMNTFRIIGMSEIVLGCLENFKVDQDYWNDEAMGKPFVVYSPMVTFGEVIHNMRLSEQYAQGMTEPNSLYEFRNINRFDIEGRWYELNALDKNNEFTYPVKAKEATPKELVQMIRNLMNSLGKTDDNILVVEFVLNCQNLMNQVYDEQTQFIPVELKDEKTLSDVVNDFDSKNIDPTAKCELPKEEELDKKSGFKEVIINSYDKKNKFKKTVKKLK